MRAIPDHVAAYAAALRLSLPWSDAADVVRLAGFGDHHPNKLATAAQQWERLTLNPAALRRVRQLGFKQRHPGRRQP